MSSSLPDSVRIRSNSEEDAELPTHDRKRARLSESGDKDSLMPRLTVSASQQASDIPISSPSSPASSEAITKPALPPRPVEAMATPSPTSKVTINTRPISSQSIDIIEASTSDEDAISPTSAVGNPLTADEPLQQQSDIAASETLTIGRSPSPTIEIAEPEEFDQDPADTRWTTRIGADVCGIPPHHVYQTFPFASDFRPGETRLAVQAIARIFGDVKREEEDIFRQVKDWFVDFATRCDTMSQEIIDQEPIFWRKLPHMVDGLWRRDQRSFSPIGMQDMIDFFLAYGQLCCLMIDYDAARFSTLQDSSQSSDFFTLTAIYLQPFHLIVDWLQMPRDQPRGVLFFDSLRRYHNFDLLLLAKPFAEKIAQPLLESIVRYIKVISAVLPTMPALHKDLLNIAGVLALATQLFSPIWFEFPDYCVLPQGHPLLDCIKDLVHSAVIAIDEILQAGIKKQHSWLSVDNQAMNLIVRLNLTVSCMAAEVPGLGKKIIHAGNVTYDDSDLTDLASTMSSAWKFMIYLKLIKNGRMELRVNGLQALSSDLIFIYNAKMYNITDGSQGPEIRYIIRFLRQNDIINYLIGPDSHPQLISRAGNLIGFFGISGAYQTSDTDSIWQAVVESSDARGATELFRMLYDALTTFELAHIYHICSKLTELPYNRWNSQTLDFTEYLLRDPLHRKLCAPHPYWFPAPVDPVVRRLCLKLIRDSLSPTTCDSDMSLRIRQLFNNQWMPYFKGISDDPNKLAMSADEESEILAQIRSDIESHNTSACGSIFAVMHILQLNPTGAIALIEKCGLPRNLVDDLAHTSKSCASSQTLSQTQAYMQFECRLDCLSLLMRTVPDHFEIDCLESLWTSVLTSTQIDPDVRTRAWDHLNSLISGYRTKPNAVADKVLQHFWPRLRPRDINNAVLTFAKNSVSYDTAFTGQSNIGDGDIVQIPGLNRVRQIMLDAEPGTVETAASEFIIDQYLRNPILAQREKSVVHATHLNLIDHWVGAVLGSAAQLRSFAEGEDSMQMIASEDEIRKEEQHFDRSLLFLRRFTEAIKGNPGCSPLSPKQEEAFPEFPDSKGATRDIIVEVGSNKYVDTGERRVAVGSENTGSELWQYLATVTGFSSFKVIHLGQIIALQEESRTVEELNITAKVQVQKTLDGTQTMPQKRLRSSSPVDEKIMLHFDDLYSLLEAEDRLAREVYTFLTITSVRKEVSHKIREMETPPSLVLPCDKPYKLLFCVQALRTCIEEESFSNGPNLTFVRYAAEALVVAFAKLGSGGFICPLQLYVAFEVLDTLLLAFRTRVPHGTGKDYVADRAEFVRHAVHYTCLAQQAGEAPLLPTSPEKAVCVGIEVLIEATLHDDRVWADLNRNEDFLTAFRYALIIDSNEKTRQAIVDMMMGLTGQSVLKKLPKPNDPRAARSRHDASTVESCLLQIWSVLITLLPSAQASSFQCQQYFDTVLGTLKRIGKVLDTSTLATMLSEWGASLLAHAHFELVGQLLTDRFVAGAAPVIQEVASLLRTQQSLSKQTELLDGLTAKFLRPPLSITGSTVAGLPVLDSSAREALYSLLLSLSQDPSDLNLLVTTFGEDFDFDDYLAPATMNDRLALRSDVGYAGLRNLSNTCYLNSLLSHLFMNVQFRELILKHGPEARDQKLVWELSKVFAYMQDFYDKSIDPSAAVDSITTWDGEQIDVHVQMDVDEFFNLLFDRLENQIADPTIRTRLKSFYGGETIQQIKSKECEHISERPETFSVLPVEIKGKASLLESLQAYVAGEVLQGDNKYSCTSCGKHVEAVKRSCLKRVPDNLIFNLKRFDFDLVTFMRAKLNDQFEFPDTLDMAPYQLENLNGENEDQTPDVFELTGVIVHSGTAETGHYYSYIRQRPSSSDANGSWVEFNDADVTAFDPSRIGDCCFGGVDNSMYGIAKYYSAYMLFYQRGSSIEETSKQYPDVEIGNPLRLSVSPDVRGHLDQENELFVRAYCMQDPVHARFIRELLRRVADLNGSVCDDTHSLEHSALKMALEYMHKISSRWKVQPDVEATANIIKTLVQRCNTCAWFCLTWFTEQNTIIWEGLICGMYAPARKTFSMVLQTCLQTLQRATDAQELTDEESIGYFVPLERLISFLHQGFLQVTRLSRCWGDYFPLIIAISDLSATATKLVIEAGFIERCLEIIYLHTFDAPDNRFEKMLRHKYHGYVALREKHRVFNHSALIQCFAHLFSKVKLGVGGEDDLVATSDEAILSPNEVFSLGFDRSPISFPWLERLIKGRQGEAGVAQVVAKLATTPLFANDLQNMLKRGLEHGDMPIAVLYVEPTLTFCEHCHDESLVRDMAAMALSSMDSIGTEYAPEYLQLVRGLLKSSNNHPSVLQPEGWLIPVAQQNIARWASPLVLGLNETTCPVRHEAAQLVNALLFTPVDEAMDENSQQYARLRNKARELALSIAKVGRNNFLCANVRDNQSMQHAHFIEAMEVVQRCVQIAYADITTAEEESEIQFIDDIMSALRSKRESVVELISPNDFDGSSDMEALSEVEGDEFNSSPA